MPNYQENILNEYTDKIFKIVAECFADGGGSKKAKPNVKELLRIVWHKANDEANSRHGEALRRLAKEILENKI